MHFQDLPHKNLLISATIALAIVGVGFAHTNTKNKNTTDHELLAQHITATSSDPADIDSDGDGLPDWKEKLYGSDIHNPDTDGDGTNDGDEVRVGRDPTVPNTAGPGNPPNDQLKYLQDPHFATSSTDIQGIRKEFFAKYLAENGRKIKEETLRDLIKTVRPEKFQVHNELIGLNVSSDNSTEAIKTYLNAFGVLIKKYTLRTHRTEDEILADAMKTKSAEKLKELQLPIISYKNFAKDLTALQVPSILAGAHLSIVNGYEGMAKGLLGEETVFDDPVNGTAGLEAYSKYKIDVTTGYAMIVAYVGHNRIAFTADEPGYPFYWNTAVSTTTKTR